VKAQKFSGLNSTRKLRKFCEWRDDSSFNDCQFTRDSDAERDCFARQNVFKYVNSV